MSFPDLFPPDAGLSITAVTVTPTVIAFAATTITPMASCPCCAQPSARVHSRYTRTAADLSWQGRRVLLLITARRFRCVTAGCKRAIFCERLPTLATHARATRRLTDAHRLIGFALGGEAGSRLAGHLALPTSPDTILRRVKSAPLVAHPTPRVLGVDDFAFRKAVNYGTILIDLERRCVIDLLPDRTADTLVAWFQDHPGVQVVSRDRASAYAQAVTTAAPTAIQVADRFHLLMNVRDVVERVLARHTTAIRDAFRATEQASIPPAEASPPSPPPERPLNPRQQAVAGRRERRGQRHEQVRQLRTQSQSIRTIAHALHISPKTVISYTRTERVPDWKPGRTNASQLDIHREYIDRRVGEGCCNARTLHHELRGLGYTGGYDQVRRAIGRRTDRDGRERASGPIPISIREEIPTARRLSFEVVRRPEQRKEQAAGWLNRLRQAGGTVQKAIELTERFGVLVRERQATGLDDWLTQADAGGLAEFGGLARSIRQDEAAVRAGLSESWSNGPVEGRINRLKLIKRSMYGRAGFALLKARVLNTG
jgi:transposase